MKYYIYKTTNKINGKIYIGYHASENIEKDSYLGSGCILKDAIKLHGKENFIREILFEFDNREDATNKERELVNEEFIKLDNNYNVVLGGCSNRYFESMHLPTRSARLSNSLRNSDKFHSIMRNEQYRKEQSERIKNSEAHKKATSTDEFRQKHSEYQTGREHPWQDKINKNPEKIEKTRQKHIGSKRTPEQCKNISESLIGKYSGKENNCYKGEYVTPYGIFDSLDSASKETGNSKICIRDRCRIKNKNKVLKFSMLSDIKITEDMLGKTWEELGWGFIDKENNV